MNIRFILTFAFACIATISVVAQPAYQRLYGTTADDGAYFIGDLPTGGRYLAGYTEIGGTRDALLVVWNAAGEIAFARRFEAPGNDEAFCAQPTQDGGFVVVGNQYNATGSDIFVLKTDGAGNLLWRQVIDGGFDERVYGKSVVATADGGYVVVGSRSAAACPDGSCYRTFVFKLSGAGAVVWGRELEISPGALDYASAVVQLPTGEILMAGRKEGGAGGADGFLTQVSNATGGGAQTRLFHGPNGNPYEYFTDLTPTPDGNYVIGGLQGQGASNVMFLRVTDAQGSPGPFPIGRWLDGGATERGCKAMQTADGGFALCAYRETAGAASGNMFVARFDPTGTILWSRTVGGAAADTAAAFVETPTGFLLAGKTASFGAGGTDIYLVHIINDGPSAACSTNVIPPTPSNHNYIPTVDNVNATLLNFTPTSVPVPVEDVVLIEEDACCAGFSIDNLTANAGCAGGFTEFSVAPVLPAPAQYQWDFDGDGVTDETTTGGNSQFRYPVPGTRTVRVYAFNPVTGCIDSAFVSVEVLANPTVVYATPDTTVCVGSPAAMTVVSGPGVQITWAPDDGTLNTLSGSNVVAQNLPVGVYVYTVMLYDAAVGCGGDTTVQVTVTEGPTADAGQDRTVCYGENATLVGAGGSEYLWLPINYFNDPTLQIQTVVMTESRDFYLRVGDGFGCYDYDTVRINVLRANAGNDTIYCIGSVGTPLRASAPGGGTDCVFQWLTNYNIVGGGADSILVNPGVDTCYVVQVTCQGCVTRDTVCVTRVPSPTVVAQVGQIEMCFGDTVTLSASGANFWGWFPNTGLETPTQSTTRAFPEETTQYIVFGADDNGCIDSEVVTVVVYNLPFPVLADTADMCLGDTLTLFGAPYQQGVIYQWSPPIGIVPGFQGLATIRVRPPVSTTYTLRIRNADYDCVERVDSIYVRVTPKPGLLFGGNPQIRCSNGPGVVLDAAFQSQTSNPCTFVWSPAATLDSPNAIQPTAFPSTTTTYTLTVDCQTLCVLRDSVTVIVNAAPNILATDNNILICAGSGGEQIQTYVSGGTPPLYYTWSPSHGLSDIYSPNPVANPDRDTTYRLVVTDSRGCESDTAFVRVRVYPLPYADAGRDTFICAGVNEGVFLNGTGFFPPETPPQYLLGGFSYEWRPAYALSNPYIANPYATPDTTTTYQLVVYSNFGCASDSTNLNAVSTVTIYVRPRPTADAGFTEYRICAGDSVTIGDLPTGQGPDYVFFWTPSTGMNDSTLMQPTVSPPYSFIYFQKALSNGCESVADTVWVVVERAPTVALDDHVEICRAYPTTLRPLVTEEGSTNLRYEWRPAAGLSNPNEKNPVAMPDTTTVYTLYAYHGPGCPPVVDSIRVSVFPSPFIVANPDGVVVTLCEAVEGDSATLPARVTETLPGLPYSIRWTPSEGLSNPNILNPRAKPRESTDYVVAMRVKDCWYYDTIRVRVRPFVTARIEGPAAVCATNAARLVGFGGIGAADFIWRWRDENGTLRTDSSRGGSSDTLVTFPLVTTTYSLTVKEGGCSQTDTFRLLVIDARSPRVFHNYPLGGCDSLIVSFADSTVGAIAWRWDFGDGTPVTNVRYPRHTYRAPGKYVVETEIYFAEGCSKIVYSEVPFKVKTRGGTDFESEPSAPVVLYMPQSTVQFFDRSLEAVAWYWDFGDGGVSTLPNPVYEFRTAGDFLVTLTTTDSIGCQSSRTKGLYKVVAPEILVPNVFSPNGDGINDYWRVEAPGRTGVNAKIFDRWGTLYYDMTDDRRGWDGTQMGSGQAAPGVYFYYVKIGDTFYDGSVTLVR